MKRLNESCREYDLGFTFGYDAVVAANNGYNYYPSENPDDHKKWCQQNHYPNVAQFTRGYADGEIEAKRDLGLTESVRKNLEENKKLDEDLIGDHPAVIGAYNYAKAKHDATGAIRQNSGLPYFVHPEMVAETVAAYGGTDEEIMAALLHDTLEDTDATAEELETIYGPEVAQIVEEITNFKPEVKRLGKEQYINKELLELSDSAMLVKVADMVVNANDSPKPGQRERIVRNFEYLLDLYEDVLDPRVRRLLKALPEIDHTHSLDKSEFDEPFDEFSDENMYLIASKKTNKEKRIFS